MTNDQWKTAYRLWDEAWQCPAEDRAAWLFAHTEEGELRQHMLAMEAESRQGDPEPAAETPERAPDWLAPGANTGRFSIERFIGRGGMGEVYAAIDTALHRRVALKFLMPRRDGSSSIESFLHEAQAISALNHPNIVTVHEVLASGPQTAIVMELVEGDALSRFRGQTQTVECAAGWGLQIARGLAAAHAHGMVHGDIKPENVMLRHDGLLKLLDFGSARKIDSRHPAAELQVGTVGYMSPEQLRGVTLTPATDLFSLGVVLWELVMGRHPFLADTTSATTAAITAATPGFHLPPGPLAGRFERLLRRLMAPDPAQRPDAAQLERELTGFVRKEEPSPQWRNWIVAAVVILIGALGFAAWVGLRETPHAPAITRFTSYEGSEIDAAFSPDGARVAFAWTGPAGGNHHIYLRPVLSESTTRLSDGEEEEYAPVFSPDGLWIAFLRRSRDSSNFLLMVVSAAGGMARPIGQIADPEGYPRPLTWWPDGNSLVVRDATPFGMALTRVQLNTGAKQTLTKPNPDESDTLPVLAPTSDRFAFVRLRLNGASVCILDLSGSEQCPHSLALPQGDSVNGLIRGLAWRHDGKALYYADKSALWHLPLSGLSWNGSRRARRLIEGDFGGLAADPRGGRLAFNRQITETNLWLLNTATGHRREIASSSADEEEPDFAPNGQAFVFRSNRGGSYELWTADLDGTPPRQLTEMRGHLGSARYSPDGSWLVFDAYGSPSAPTRFTNVYVVPARGGKVRRLTSDEYESIIPNWSMDGRWIYYLRTRNAHVETWKMPFPDGEPVRVAEFGMQDLWEAPGGRELYYAKRQGAAGIYHRPVNGGAEAMVSGTGRVRLIRYWQPFAKGFLFADAEVGALMRQYDGDSQRAQIACPFPGKLPRGPRGLAATKDGRYVIYTSEDLALSDIGFIENVN